MRTSIVLVFLSIPAAVFAEARIELDIKRSHDVQITESSKGVYRITTTGNDPWVMTRPFGRYDPEKEYVFAFDYFCAKGLSGIQIFYGPPIRGDQSAEGPEVLSSEGWTSYSMNIKEKQRPGTWKGGYNNFRIDFGNRARCVIQIKNIKLRPPTAAEQKTIADCDRIKKTRAEFEKKMMAVVETQHAVKIKRVEVTESKIKITIKGLPSSGEFQLCEIPVYQTHVGRNEYVWKQNLVSNGTFEVDRIRDGHDRVFSSWVVTSNKTPVSHQRFADTIPAKWKLDRDRPLSKKGTVGMHGGNRFQYDDYATLGIHNCTKNIVLHSLIGQKPAGDTFEHEFNGRKYYIRKKALQRLDRAMMEMNELKIVVSAIILIAKNLPMTHPDCTPQGIWAMPNVVEKEGWNYYAAGLDFLASRYMRPDRKYGRITHWIMHNEVDAGWVWTNAGEKPLHTYFDLYYRSMRTAQSVIRRYGNAGNVLISLTHYWTRAHNHLCYHPKDMLDLLQKRSAQEGNFDWGLAYHPYPQNLRDPRTWLDSRAKFSFQTELITPKNLEVLDAYMRQERMLYAGKPRTVVLSEQGSNSRDHSAKSYRDQAAGLVYTWLKFEKLDIIESYVHHRWMDPKPGGEGGLLLGFWTNLPDREPRHTKKPAWEMYKVLGTDRQNVAVDYAKGIIPSEYLKDIPYKGRISAK